MISSERTCGPNVTTKFTRYVVQKAKYGGADCEGEAIKIEQKDLSPCKVDCKLGDWSEPRCPKCQPRGQPETFTTITREVVRPAAHGGRNNCTEVQKVVKCDGLETCKEPCRWGQWSYSECSATCGTAYRTKSRSEICPFPEIGSQEDVQELCSLPPCPSTLYSIRKYAFIEVRNLH